ncbi:hypothetical protein N8612_04910 [Verrucomicrobia bacterium]|jgi:hypothetical protein|nr:hypothetical protein [Verrucomicrobiota bacterium]
MTFIRQIRAGLQVTCCLWLSSLGLSAKDLSSLAALESTFTEEIYPLLQRGGQESCLACHDPSTSSDLEFIGDVRDDFQMLLGGGYFDGSGPDSLLGRLEAANPKRRMPKGDEAPKWSASEIQKLRTFSLALTENASIQSTDEGFPLSLMQPYRGISVDDPDTQFISYTQLKGKIATLFGDDWVRDGVDRFKENVALFGGADFETRFNESSQASSGFMSALRRLAQDVAERVYVTQSGPFSEPIYWDANKANREAGVRHLYQHILHRHPSGDELKQGEALRRSIEAQRGSLDNRGYELGFSVEVADPSTGLQSYKSIRIPVRAGSLSVIQERVDLSLALSGKGPAKHQLAYPVELSSDGEDQALILQVGHSSDPSSFAGLLLEHVDGASVEWIDVRDPRVQLEGAWKLSEKKGFWSAELEEGGRGDRVKVSIEPDFDGMYRVSVYWRPSSALATDTIAEMWHRGSSNILVQSQSGPELKDGMVQFFFDGTIDAVPHVDFEDQFRFGESGYIEVNNFGTKDKVAVGPIGFLAQDGSQFEVDTKEAEGFDLWSPFKAISFNAYNNRGTRVEDKNERKGELFLRYFPRARVDSGWALDEFYKLRVYYPGKRNHESRTPVMVRSESSSPIIRVSYPLNAGRGNLIRLDASDSFTTQGSPLQVRWKQVSGMPVGLTAEGPVVEVKAPRTDPAYHFWVALTQALIRHPDFLFTRSPALNWVTDQNQRRRLKISRLALDLVGRSPTVAELQSFLQRWDWNRVVDYYIASDDFRRFYQHRIRLYLESQGTTLQDEPVRLWCYVAFNDRPFHEILTGSYTVDETMMKQTRPIYHGKTGLLTTPGFIEGKPGLPHYNYAAQVSMLFLGYRYEVPADIVEQREGVTALGTTDPSSACYSCHKILTPLAFQRNFWTDEGKYRRHDEYGLPIEASDHGMVSEYPFKGEGLESFALEAVKKERFIRTMIDTHFNFLFGRSMRYRTDERDLYRTLWDSVHEQGFTIKGLLRALVTSPEYYEDALAE